MEYVDQEYWDDSYREFTYFLAKDQVTEFIDSYIEDCNDKKPKSCFEIGCFPGRYLCYMGKKNYIVNGIDMSPRVEKDFIRWLDSMLVKVGKVTRGDYLEYISSTNDTFDLVYSIGFIEHFKEYKAVIDTHDKILKTNGILMIITPNFRGTIQQILHSLLDKENLKRHNLEAMAPEEWKHILEEKGYKILYSGYFGAFDFWVDREKRGKVKRGILKLIEYINKLLKGKKVVNSKLYSPYCAIVARKN